jgi:putative sterol carrier protein
MLAILRRSYHAFLSGYNNNAFINDGSRYAGMDDGDPMERVDFQKVVDSLNQSFKPERAKGLNAVIQVEVTGSADFVLTIQDQKLAFTSGKATAPRLTLRASASDLEAIFTRKLDPTAAFFQGKLVVQGDMGLAMQLPGLFS